MDNNSTSEWSSGCESGWTMYLDESYVSPNVHKKPTRNNCKFGDYNHQNQSYRFNNSIWTEDFEEEEGLSMVSDASSGPQHFQEYEEEGSHYRYSTTSEKLSSKKKKKSENKSKKGKEHKLSYTNLDDTASSPAICYSKVYGSPSNNQEPFMGFSQNLSTTHFQETSAFNNPYAFWHSHPKNTDSAEPSQLKGRRWE